MGRAAVGDASARTGGRRADGRALLAAAALAAMAVGMVAIQSADAKPVNDYGEIPPGATVVECTPGTPMCTFDQFIAGLDDPATNNNNECAPYNERYVPVRKLDWVLGMSAVVGALMAFGIGANDAANAWATSVGSGAIPLLGAVLIGGAMEFAGATSLGYGVAKSIKGVANISDTCWRCGRCDTEMSVYIVGMFSALAAAGIFLLLASFTAMPVSTTHAIVGGMVGVTLVGQGGQCLNWSFEGGLSGIIASWVISPVASGVIALITYFITRYLIIKLDWCGKCKVGNPRINSLIGMPILFGLQTFVVLLMILIKSPQVKKTIDMTQKIWISIVASIGVAIVSGAILIPLMLRRFPSVVAKRNEASEVEEGKAAGTGPPENVGTSPSFGDADGSKRVRGDGANSSFGTANRSMLALGSTIDAKKEIDYPTAADSSTAALQPSEWDLMSWEERDANFTFRFVLVFVGALEAFAHGANDTSNATGAFSAVYQTWSEGLNECGEAQTPVWIMAVAGGFVALGVILLGFRVIRTIGEGLIAINFHRGFCIEFATTFTVVIATFLGMPVSTTHCQVGAVVFIGIAAFGPKHVKWWLFGSIVATWVLTLPFAGLIGAALTAGIRVGIRR